MRKFHLYIVVTRTNTVLSRLIQLVKNDEYTHAAIALDMELDSMYSFGRKHTYNPFVGGLSEKPLMKEHINFARLYQVLSWK